MVRALLSIHRCGDAAYTVSDQLAKLVVPELEDSTEDLVADSDVLPALQTLHLEVPPSTSPAIKKFVAVRQLSSRTVTVVNTRKYDL